MASRASSRTIATSTAGWYIDAVQPLADYPVAVVVSSSGAHALVGWSRQAAMFAAFAVCGVRDDRR